MLALRNPRLERHAAKLELDRAILLSPTAAAKPLGQRERIRQAKQHMVAMLCDDQWL